MNVPPSLQKYGLAIAIFGAGAGFAWLWMTDTNAYLRLATLPIAALSVGLLVHVQRRHEASARAEREARLILESMPGPDWSTEALRARERELQLIVDTVPTLIWVVTSDGEPAYISKRLEAYYGLTVDDLEEVDGSRVKGAVRARVHPDDAAAVQRGLLHSFETGEPFAMRYRNLRADGVYRWVDGRAEPFRDENGRILKWYGVVIDTDDEKRAQDALRAAQERLSRAAQLASLAELSASIAHEVNQPLAALMANSHACQRWLSANPPNMGRARITAERIVRDAMAAADVVSRIRALFTQKVLTRSLVDLNEVIGEICRLMTDEMTSEGILIQTRLNADLPPVFADRVQMQQVLVNLIRNGVDAMKSNVDVPRSLEVKSRRDGTNMVMVEVRDTGRGLTEPRRPFEPFFTTKNGGMGMGLTICRSIVEAHDGRLWAESVEPRGAAFSFTLPMHSGDVT